MPAVQKPHWKPLRVDESPLHRVQPVAVGEPFDGRHLPAGGSEGRHQATVDGHAVEPGRAGPAIPGVAPLLDAEPAQVAQEGAQALPGAWLQGEALSVDVKAHASLPEI